MKCRFFLKAIPAAGTALAVPALAKGGSQQDTDRDRMIRVIEQLEARQSWERSNVVAAKAFAAWQMRKALGLDLPDPEYAQMHVYFQRGAFDGHQRSVLAEQDRMAGKVYSFTEDLA